MGIKLDAVNVLLSAIGEDPVQSLETGIGDAESAEDTLERVSREVQETGWHCNTDHGVTLTPDIYGNIYLADDIIRIDSDGASRSFDVVEREDPNDSRRKLFNRKTQSFRFDAPITVTLVRRLPFETLPLAMRRYIVAEAAIVFQMEKLTSVVVDRLLEKQRDKAWAAFQDAESENEDLNILRDSIHARRMSWRNNDKMGT